MTKRINAIVCVALSFMFLFISIGYSALTDNIIISGEAKVEVPIGLFITNITPQGTSNVDHQSVSFLEYTTTVDSTIDKKNDTVTTSGRPNRPTVTTTTYEGKVTYEITVFNNTNYEYAYRGLYYQNNLDGYSGNSKVSTSAGSSRIGVVVSFENDNSVVAPGKSLTFTATYTIGKDVDDETDWKTLLNFQFGINVETEAAARDAVHAKFLDILNTSTTYNELVDVLDNKYDGRQEWTSNYIGNVDSSVTDDTMAVETLFAGQLNMIINGATTKAKVIIKHENLDGNNKTGDDYVATNSSNGGVFRGYGCEMTLYLTTDPLTQSYGWAPVYVSVFTCDRDDDGNIVGGWYQIGDTYVGEANIVGYNGGNGGTGSFVTDNWVSTPYTYDVSDGYSYYLPSGKKLKDNGSDIGIMNTYDAQAISTFEQLLIDAKAMIEDLKYAGTGITIVEDAYIAASKYYTLDASGNPIANTNVNRVWLIQHIRSLDHALTEARKEIENLPKS